MAILGIILALVFIATLAMGLGTAVKFWRMDGWWNWKFHLPFIIPWGLVLVGFLVALALIGSSRRWSPLVLGLVAALSVGLALYDHAYGRGMFPTGSDPYPHYAFWWWWLFL